ncbi:MAG: PssE/Cps14G family polysaccharide biosynthesis glycosyltransferase [Eubacteriales bacterium]|nr:PssE/Cps14G family polysaccharide biosynthesis glycosyltransferase [Eubacteriales bacterium]
MVFVTVGSQKFPFNRLLEQIDGLMEKGVLTEEVFAQTGYSDYLPKHYAFAHFLDRKEFAAWEEKAEIVISHGGTGAMIGAVKKGKKVIAVPRLARYGEHVDDHQLQIIAEFEKQNLVYGLRDCSELEKALQFVRMHAFGTYTSNIDRLIADIETYIEDII